MVEYVYFSEDNGRITDVINTLSKQGWRVQWINRNRGATIVDVLMFRETQT
jgi:hypothetical protein